jgi:probable HAF family extracellular repeat protein
VHRTFFGPLTLTALGLVACNNPVRPTVAEPSHTSQLAANSRETARYSVRDLGTLGGDFSSAGAINERGEVVGQSTIAPEPAGFLRGFLWTKSGGMRGLDNLGGDNSQATDINDRGFVVGWSELHSGSPVAHAFLRSPAGHIRDLGTLGGPNSFADALNNGREEGASPRKDRRHVMVVGTADTKTGETHAFLWTAKHGMEDLGTLGGPFSEAVDVNDAGQVVGLSLIASGDSRAFTWTREHGMRDLGTIPGFTQFMALTVGEHGEVGGRGTGPGFPPGPAIPFVWTEHHGFQFLDMLGAVGASDWGINEAGLRVGGGAGSDTDRFAAVWMRNGHGMRLPMLGGEDEHFAFDINESGTIVGMGRNGTGHVHAALWTPREEDDESTVVAAAPLQGRQTGAAARVRDADSRWLCALEHRLHSGSLAAPATLRECRAG